MTKKQFDEHSPELGLALSGVALLLLATLIVSQLILVFNRGSLRCLLFALAAFSLLLLFLVAAAFVYRYRADPLVLEKETLLGQNGRFDEEFKKASDQIDQCVEARRTIDSDTHAARARRKAAYQNQLDDIQRRRRVLDQQERQALSSELQRIQQQHVDIGLRETLVETAHIPGVGPDLKGRLVSQGIRTAADVTPAAVAQVPGFGETHTSAVAKWRADTKAHLQLTVPNYLPFDLDAKIREEFDEQRARLDREAGEADSALDADLAAIDRQEAGRHAENDARQTQAQDRLAALEPHKQELEAHREEYADVNPLAFFLAAMQPVIGEGDPRRRLLLYLVPFALIATFFCQGSAALRALVGAPVDAAPTATPAASARLTTAPTASLMPAATAALTATATQAPSLTPSPTASLTPSAAPTRTPTPAVTPSSTPAPTGTATPPPSPTPVATLPAIPQAVSVPRDTLRQVGQVVEVTGGDTIVVRIDGQDYPVRYIGIDAPGPDEPLGPRAAAKNADLVAGKTVTLVKDVSETDQEGRLLRYVFVESFFVNHELVRRGLARAVAAPPDTTSHDAFLVVEEEARQQQRNLWKLAPAPTPTPQPTATATRTPLATATATGATRATATATGVTRATATATPATLATATPTPAATLAPPGASPVPSPLPPSPPAGTIAFPVWDGQRAAYDTYLARAADGSDLRLVLTDAHQPAFRPGGDWLALNGEGDLLQNLLIVRPNGSDLQEITEYTEDSFPAWSADGKSLAFSSTRHGDRQSRIYVIDSVPIGGSRAQGRALKVGVDDSNGFYPAWTDGGQIVYSGCDYSAVPVRCGLLLLSAAAGPQTAIQVTGQAGDTAPAVYGSRIAFMSDRDGNWEIYLVNLDGSGLRRLTDSPANDGLPAWAPDGRTIAFVSDQGGIWAVWAVDPDGSNRRKLFNIGGNFGPDWEQERISWGP
jgi:endonuclease YncB( thermonuclease family)